jgi:hypothetical protein
MSDTTVTTKDGRTSVSTGDMFTIWRSGDDRACACQVATLHVQVLELQAEIEKLRADKGRLEKWVNDLHSGMYINCVYCGHRYGPHENTPVAMADVLTEHCEQCPQHPLSAAKAEIERLRELLREYHPEAWARITKRITNQRDEAMAEIEKLREELSQRPPSYDDYFDTLNWRGAVTHKLQPDVSGDISRGHALELISRLKCGRFRVTNGEEFGWCYSFYDHFELHWDDGSHELWRAELSTDGTRKADDQPH